MIFRCTARFLQAFDVLDARTQMLVLKSVKSFEVTPRAPNRDVRVVPETSVWVLPCGNNVHITYSFANEDREPNHFICVLRNVGRDD